MGRPEALERELESRFFKAGQVLNRKFRLERLIGQGGMGMVVSATHLMLDQPVAIKLLFSDDPESVARLTTEARNAAKLQSEHVARVKDVEVGEDGHPYIVMELLGGSDLDALLAEHKRLPASVAVDYILEALEGMAEAHARGIIHRDLKPSNLFLATVGDRQIIKVLDFGVSKTLTTNQQLTGKGAVLGSPPYMSPEQVRAPKTLDHRSDIWSLGVVLYELLTGELPFLGEEVQETFALILERPVPPFTRHRIEAPPGLEAIVMRCLEKDRNRRFFDVAELAQALAPYAGRNADSAHETARILSAPPDDPTTGITPSHIRPKRALTADGLQTPSGVFIPNPTSADGPSTLIGNGTYLPHSLAGNRFRQFAEWAIWVVPGMLVAIAFAGFLVLFRSPALNATPRAVAASPPIPEAPHADSQQPGDTWGIVQQQQPPLPVQQVPLQASAPQTEQQPVQQGPLKVPPVPPQATPSVTSVTAPARQNRNVPHRPAVKSPAPAAASKPDSFPSVLTPRR